jgi:hypothetical protein
MVLQMEMGIGDLGACLIAQVFHGDEGAVIVADEGQEM